MHALSRGAISNWLPGLSLLLFLGVADSADLRADDQRSITLLSDEAADVCIKDTDCMGRLFMQAVFGDEEAPDTNARQLVKWTEPPRIVSITGSQVTDDVQAVTGLTLRQMRDVAAIAGSDLDVIDGDTDEVVNIILLISGDFAGDRDGAFSDLLSDVFAGQTALYDDLAAGPPPVCRSQLFVEQEGSVAGGLALSGSDVDAATFRRCLHRTVLGMLGFPHPLPDDVDSVLNPESERQAWTSIDFMLLRMLNDPDVIAGMSREELAAVFPDVHQRALSPSG